MSKPGHGGRPAKPTALRVLHGDKRSRMRQGEPVPGLVEVKPPETLDAEAVAIWNELAPDLIAKGVLTAWDVHEFGAYCQTKAYAYRAERLISGSDLLLRGRDKNDRNRVVRNPALMAYRDMTDMASRLGGRFGLTPADRAGLATGERNPMAGEDLLSGNWSG